MKVGKFSLELINAETKEPLKEFTAPDGKVYVEAEPDLEYFIRCHRDRAGERGRRKDDTISLYVDGKYLGYTHSFSTTTRALGLWKRQNGVSTHRALKLVLKRTPRGAAGSSSSPNTTPVGSVRANFYETIFTNDRVERVDNDRTNCLNQSSGSTPAFASGAKKAFASVSGSATVSKNVRKRKKRTRRGKCLGEMTIHYTSALGLSQLGILAPIVPAVAVAVAAAAVPPVTSSSSSSTRPRNNAADDDGPASTEPARKRVKTESTTSRLVSPISARSNNSIDLTTTTTGDLDVGTRRRSNNVIDLTSDNVVSAPSDNLIDLTGDD